VYRCPCANTNALPMPISFPDGLLCRLSEEFSVILKPESSSSRAVKKKQSSNLLPIVEELLRPQGATCPRTFVWRPARLCGTGSSTPLVSEVREGETATVRLYCRSSVLHQAVCLLCGQTESDKHHQRCCQGTAFRLEDGPSSDPRLRRWSFHAPYPPADVSFLPLKTLCSTCGKAITS